MSPRPHVLRRGHGLPVIMVHGNGVDHRLLLALDDCFVDEDWERIYLDLPGFGRTPRLSGAGGLPELANWLVATVRELVGERPFAVVANSLGGLLARHVVARLPDQVVGLALLAPVVEPDPVRRTLPEFAVAERDADLLARLGEEDRDEFTGIMVRQSEATWDAFREYVLPGIRLADQVAVRRLASRYFLVDVPEVVSVPFDAPTVIVTGRRDQVVGYVDQFGLVDHYRAATYVALDGAGHNVHLDQPTAVAGIVRDWARRVRDGRRRAGAR